MTSTAVHCHSLCLVQRRRPTRPPVRARQTPPLVTYPIHMQLTYLILHSLIYRVLLRLLPLLLLLRNASDLRNCTSYVGACMWVWYCRPPIGAYFHPTPQPPPVPQQLLLIINIFANATVTTYNHQRAGCAPAGRSCTPAGAAARSAGQRAGGFMTDAAGCDPHRRAGVAAAVSLQLLTAQFTGLLNLFVRSCYYFCSCCTGAGVYL